MVLFLSPCLLLGWLSEAYQPIHLCACPPDCSIGSNSALDAELWRLGYQELQERNAHR